MKIVEVKLRHNGKTFTFDSNGVECCLNELVIVESERGFDYGHVISEMEGQPENMKKVLRPANDEDLKQIEKNENDIARVIEAADKKINERRLSMKLVEAEYSFDRTKIIFYFTAEGRVDFRELVRDLAHMFRARIELKQIGVRDEVKMFGGFGCCGRELCCASFLKDFEPVTIRMAKQQNMPLNPEKISGLCGRLMCCLGYEYPNYRDAAKILPRLGEYIQTEEGKGRVIAVNILSSKVTVELEDERKLEIEIKPDHCRKHERRKK